MLKLALKRLTLSPSLQKGQPMLQFLTKLVSVEEEAEDGPGGLVGLNMRMTHFAESNPVIALLVIGVLVACVIYLAAA
jgi:hypothetical protein